MNVRTLKTAVAALIISIVTTASLNNSSAAQPDALGSVWRQGMTDTTAWIIGTLRPVSDLDELVKEEASSGDNGNHKKPLQDNYLRVEAQCADDDFTIRVKASAFEQEPPQITNETPYSLENSPLRDASIDVNGNASLNLHYLWGAISGASQRADDRLSLAGSMFRFLSQIGQQPKSEIKIYTPKGSASYVVDNGYQASANQEAIAAFKSKCATAASNWH
jgi:hypothetical protein